MRLKLISLCNQIDRLSLEGYANLDAWVADLDSRVEEALLARLHEVVERWCKQLSGSRPSSPSDPAVASEVSKYSLYSTAADQISRCFALNSLIMKSASEIKSFIWILLSNMRELRGTISCRIG